MSQAQSSANNQGRNSYFVNIKKVLHISINTYRELLRERYFLIVVFLGVILLLLSLALKELTFDEQEKLLADFGFLAIHVAAIGIGLITGAMTIPKEIEKQTCLLTLSRPVSRSGFLMGKLLGIIWMITVVIVALTLALVLFMNKWGFLGNFFLIAYSVWLEAIVLLFFVVLFSVFVRPVLSFMMGLVVMFLGQWLTELEFLAKKSKDLTYINAIKFARWVVPNFDKINWKNFYFIQEPPTTENILWVSLHFLAWSGFLFVLAKHFFEKKDIV